MKKQYPLLDLVKLIAALLVVLIHIAPAGTGVPSVDPNNQIPLFIGQAFVAAGLRIAVPIFFTISAFLLFKKIENDKENKWKHIGKFCLRILFLYLFWYVVLTPITTLEIIEIVKNNIGDLWLYIVKTFVKGAPHGFWYLLALVLGVVIVGFIKDKKSLIAITVIASIFYAIGCFFSSYLGVFSNNAESSKFCLVVTNIVNMFELNISLFQGLLFVLFGYLFAKRDPFKIPANTLFMVLIFLSMVGEYFILVYTKLFIYSDACFMMPVFVFFAMNLFLRLDIKNEKVIKVLRRTRKVTNLLYLFHFQFLFYFYLIMDSLGITLFSDYWFALAIPYFGVIILAFALQTLFEFLSKFKYLRFFKYSY